MMNYALEDIRVGYMVNNVEFSGIFRGNSEFLLEGFGSEIFKGPGTYLAGGQLIYRYNFVSPTHTSYRILKLAAADSTTTRYRDQVQHRLGEAFEFVLHSGLRVRWMITDRWGLSVEGDYHHISDAGLSSRNSGLNSIGGTLGVNWLF